MDTCEHLARIGYAALLADRGGPTVPEWADEDDSEAVAAAAEAARLADHAKLRDVLIHARPEPRAGELLGAKWVRLITWPDRVPGLKTWAGQSTLPKIIAAHQRRLRESDATDLFAAKGHYRTSKGEGPSGFDAITCQDARDAGFSPSRLGMDIECRPAVELLAIVGLETVPLVSFSPRDCGFLRDGCVWRFTVEQRGGYFYRWGALTSYQGIDLAVVNRRPPRDLDQPTVDRLMRGDGVTANGEPVLGPDGEPLVALTGTQWRELSGAAGAVLDQLDYLQNLWGKEGVTNSLAERLRKALGPPPNDDAEGNQPCG